MIAVAAALTFAQQSDLMERSYIWRDPKQDRSIHVRVTYPTQGNHMPVVVLSHGLRGSENSLNPLVHYWVEHGYTVLQPRHEDSPPNPSSNKQLASLRIENPFRSWRSRLLDCEFMYSVCAAIERWVPELKGRIESKKIIQAGYSFGAHTSQVLGGAKINGRSFASASPIAFCCISPQGIGEGRKADSWKGFKRPLLVISGTNDTTPSDDAATKANPERRQDPYKLSPPGNKYLLWIQGANHNFGGITGRFDWQGAGSPNAQHLAWVQKTTLAFFDAYARSDNKQMKWLRSYQLASETKGDAVLSWR